jgi:hypothetical protein
MVVVNYPVHHNRLGSQTALLECVPIQVVQHCCNTAGCVVVASNKPSCSSFGKELNITSKGKYLGITISLNLSWNNHIDNVCRKANNTTTFLHRNMSSICQSRSQSCKLLRSSWRDVVSSLVLMCRYRRQSSAAKLHHYGVRGPTLNWIKSFLAGHTQRVIVEGVASDSAPVTSGVPQGIVLGSLLFLAYINVGSQSGYFYFQKTSWDDYDWCALWPCNIRKLMKPVDNLLVCFYFPF